VDFKSDYGFELNRCEIDRICSFQLKTC
jgi:hypothetical protein